MNGASKGGLGWLTNEGILGVRNGAFERVLAILSVLAMLAAIFVVVAPPSQAHTPRVNHDCYGWSVDLTRYNTRNGTNSVLIKIDGVTVVDQDFAQEFHDSGTWDPTESHTIYVRVVAWDDPNFEKGWSMEYSGDEEACERPSTTTTEPPTTTTTEPTTTTTESTTTTTTEPTTTTTTESTTTTTEPTTTTTKSTTTTTEPTTTTTESTTTTTDRDRDCCDDDDDDGTTTTTTTTTTQPSEPEVSDEVIEATTTTAPPDVESDEVLPFTGIESNVWIGLGLALTSAGLMLVVAARSRQES